MMKPKEVIALFEALTKDERNLPKEEEDVLLLKLSHHVTKYWQRRGEKELVSDSPVLGFVACCLDGLALLCETLNEDDDCPISIQQQQVFSKVLQLLIGFGISPCLDPGICTTLRDKKVPCLMTCPLEKNLYLQSILLHLLPFLCHSFYSSLITKHLNVLLSICAQVIYGPHNPARVAALQPDLAAKAAQIDLLMFKKCLSDLLTNTYPPVIVKELLGLQIPKAGARAPRWLVALSGDLLSGQVMRPQGLRNVSRGLFEQFESVNSVAYEDQILCDKIADVLLKIPKRNPDTYIESLAAQTYSLLRCDNKVLRIQYLRLFKGLVHRLSDNYPEVAFKAIWLNVFQPFVLWKEDRGKRLEGVWNEDSKEGLVCSEDVMEECLCTIATLAEFGMFQGDIADTISAHFLLPILNFYHHIYGGISHLKTKTVTILKDIIKESDHWVKSIEFFIESDLSLDRNITFANGPSGGIILSSQPQREVTDNVVEVAVQLLKCKQGSLELCDFFLAVFKDISHPEQERNENFLEVDDEFTKFQVKLRKIMLVENLCQEMGQDLLKNTTQTIHLLKTIILQKSETVQEGGDELLLVCFGIIGTYLRDEIQLTEGDEAEIKSLIEPLTRISECSDDEMIMSTANDLRICIATKINLDEASNVKTLNKEGVKDEFSYEQMLKDLSDPLLPSRAHAIMQLGKKVKEGHPAATTNISSLCAIVLDHITHTDSYIFLAAIKCLQNMSWYNTAQIIDVLVKECLNTRRKADDRAKVGEALVGVFKVANEMLPAHESTIFQCLLTTASKQSDEVLRVSAMSCLAELCFLCKHGVLGRVQEVLYLAEVTLLEDQSPLAQKAALLVISKVVQGQGKDIFYKLREELLQLYRLLKRMAHISPHTDVRLHANLALGTLADIVEEFLFPKPSYKHEIKIDTGRLL